MRDVYAAHARPLRRYLMRLTNGSAETAEDLLQETMLRAWRHRDALPAGAEPLRRWLFTVARNLTIDAVRAGRARPAEVSDDDLGRLPATGDPIDGVLDRRLLDEALRRLTAEHRAVLVSLYFRDATVAEAAAAIGVPEGTVRSRSFYALRTVRALLSSEMDQVGGGRVHGPPRWPCRAG
ncbi:sigma-70 family RNA polymerase sigma factor [Actinoplanes sp. NPDC049265]|uniref:sigma-70 family RNA polymerase sigma factor n=1 Tax=Actinoplanes sp. NPDC049265 TaxID=3363902 RepID=UPI00371CEF76